MILIVGLGNPGGKYKRTRHNLGFMALDALARKFTIYNLQFTMKTNLRAEILKTKIHSEELILAKPQTMMNASGFAVAKMASSFQLPASNIWIIHDDVDLPLGKIKIRVGGAAAGHHGVESIIEHLGTDEFVRFRLGIGHPGRGADALVERYVLREFDVNEAGEVKQMIKKTVKALKGALKDGVEKAMSQFNR